MDLVETAAERAPSQEDRTPARTLWTRIQAWPRSYQYKELQQAPTDHRWALCEALCLENQRLCVEDPVQAAVVAELALKLVDRVAGEEPWRAKLRGFAWAHVGNALRAQGDLKAAERAFRTADRFWKAGEEARNGLLEEGVLFAFKAMLRWSQRRFEGAAELLDQAFAAASGAKFRVQVLVSKARLCKETGDLEQAVAILREASDIAIPDDDGQVVLCVQHNLADGLSKLGRFPEAEALLPAAIDLSRRCGGEVDFLRLLWIEGRVAAGLGKTGEAVAALRRVRGEFAARPMSYDTALVSLELAALYAEQGQTQDVKNLARHLVPILQAREVHPRVSAALVLFRQIAEREEVTPAFAREVLIYLRKARHDPDLSFERQAGVDL
ncbi:MAG TPA: tetratricopeptide repeat protein [Thermoanaerobaculia bacterium]|jgi:tetratricopeptide (TPR) repeat protein